MELSSGKSHWKIGFGEELIVGEDYPYIGFGFFGNEFGFKVLMGLT